MRIHIKEVEKHQRYFVNGKWVWKDMNGSWMERPELTTNEKDAFVEYLELINEEN